MKYLLVFLAALLLTGCSVEVAHETENKSQNESLSTFDKNKTTVVVGILKVPESRDTDSHESTTLSIQRSQTTVKVVVPESSPRVLIPTPPVPRRSEPTIQVAGDGNTVAFGDVHIHHHEHFHIHQTPTPHPVRINVRVKVGDRFSERERRQRMVERRIARFFPHYRD